MQYTPGYTDLIEVVKLFMGTLIVYSYMYMGIPDHEIRLDRDVLIS